MNVRRVPWWTVLGIAALLLAGCPDEFSDDDHGPDDDDVMDDDDVDDDTVDDDDDDDAAVHYCYSETVDPDAALADLDLAYTGDNWHDTIMSVTFRRYPSAHALLVEMKGDPDMESYVVTTSFYTLMHSLMTLIQQETVTWDYDNSSWYADFTYWVNEDWQPRTTFHEGFPRSTIAGSVDESASYFSDLYLTGEAGDGIFVEQLEALNAHINGLAALALVGEYVLDETPARDGALAMMYFLELYIQHARTVENDFFQEIKNDELIVDLVLIQWLRLYYFLEISAEFDLLGVHDEEIAGHVLAEPNLWEIQNFTGYELTDSSCIPEGDTYAPPF